MQDPTTDGPDHADTPDAQDVLSIHITEPEGSQDDTPTESIDNEAERRSRLMWAAAVGAILIGVALIFIFFVLPALSPNPLEGAPVLETIVPEPIPSDVPVTDWDAPSGIAIDGDSVFVSDSGNNRILELDHEGVVKTVICETGDCAFLLDDPQDVDTHDGLIYVANGDAGTVEVVNRDNEVVQTIQLPTAGAVTPRVTGIDVADDGTVYASDASSGLIAVFSPDGTFSHHIGEDSPVGAAVFDDPRGVRLDGQGNITVAEYEGGRARKVSPEGRDLASYWLIPNAVQASDPTDVAFGERDLVYMSDELRGVVQVFSVAGTPRGIVGLLVGDAVGSPSALLSPQGVDTDGDHVYVIDAERGMLVFRVDPAFFLGTDESR